MPCARSASDGLGARLSAPAARARSSAMAESSPARAATSALDRPGHEGRRPGDERIVVRRDVCGSRAHLRPVARQTKRDPTRGHPIPDQHGLPHGGGQGARRTPYIDLSSGHCVLSCDAQPHWHRERASGTGSWPQVEKAGCQGISKGRDRGDCEAGLLPSPANIGAPGRSAEPRRRHRAVRDALAIPEQRGAAVVGEPPSVQ